MKKILLTIITALSMCLAYAQTYTTGQKDIFGNTTTTVKDPQGRNTCSYTTGQKDIFGNTTTMGKDQYGRTTRTATTGQTDIFGNTTTTVKDQYAWPIE